MRTTGLRVPPAKEAVDDETLSATGQGSEVTIDHSVDALVAEKKHPNITLEIISRNLPPKEGFARELSLGIDKLADLKVLGTPIKSHPPRKPPRSIRRKTPSPGEEDEHLGSPPGPPLTPTALYELKKLESRERKSGYPKISDLISNPEEYNTTCAISSQSQPSLSRNLSTSQYKVSPVKTLFNESQMAWRNLRRRILPEDIPPLPSTPPPSIPSTTPTTITTTNSVFYPSMSDIDDNLRPSGRTTSDVSVRPRNTQGSPQRNSPVTRPEPVLPASRRRATPPTSSERRQPFIPPTVEVGVSASGARTRDSPGQEPNNNNYLVDQEPIASTSEFESTCKQVFRLQRSAQTLMQQNQYNKAAIKYQMSLGLIDNVLKTRVLILTPDEPTRQRFFHLQEAVFATRKECLNGFSDAQAAIALPQELSTTAPPPGAPPSYQDVLREDRKRTRGAPPPVPVRPSGLTSPNSSNRTSPSLTQSYSQSLRTVPSRVSHIGSVVSQSHTHVSNSPASSAASRLPLLHLQPRNQPLTLHQAPLQPPLNQPQVQVSLSQQRDQCPQAPIYATPRRSSKTQPNTLPEPQAQSFSENTGLSNSESKSRSSKQSSSKLCVPKPKPRTVLPQATKLPNDQLSADQEFCPVTQLKTRITHELEDKHKGTELENRQNREGQSSHAHSPEFDDVSSISQSQVEDQLLPPAPHGKKPQPIGDLLRRVTSRGVVPSDRNKKAMSLIAGRNNIHVSEQSLKELSNEPQITKEPSNSLLHKTQGNTRQRPKTLYHDDTNTQFPPQISAEDLYDVPKPLGEPCTTHLTVPSESTEAKPKLETRETAPKQTTVKTRPPKPLRRKFLETQETKIESEDLQPNARNDIPLQITHTTKNMHKTAEESLHIYDNFPCSVSTTSVHEPIQINKEGDRTTKPLFDPFAMVDPFPPINTDNFHNISFTASNLSTSSLGAALSNFGLHSNLKNVNPLPTPIKPVPATLQPMKVTDTGKDSSGGIRVNTTDIETDNLGDSILDALDFAVSPKNDTSSQTPKQTGYLRCRSEDTLLDYSYNTLGRYLESTSKGADNIDEFDPLQSNQASSANQNEGDLTLLSLATETGSNTTLTPTNEIDRVPVSTDSYYAVPRKLKWKSTEIIDEKKIVPAQGGLKDERIPDQSGGFYENTKPEAANHYYNKDNYVTSPYHIYAEVGTRSSTVSSSGSAVSWPSDTTKYSTSSAPNTPSTAGTSGHPSSLWGPYLEESEEDETTDIGRSAFYSSVSAQQEHIEKEPLTSHVPPSTPPPLPEGGPGSSSFSNSTFRELLRIREGVKIFFIHEDGVVTSPWNRPFLSFTKDSTKLSEGHGLLLRVGKNLWSCEVSSKTTLVFKADSSTYVFKETNNKPECIAVAVRIPSNVRKVQHELLARFMNANTRLEEERPSRFTKSVSKGAASAAVKVSKIVENNETERNQAFVRRNSIRALKGVSRGLNSLAEKTGSSIPELPEEFICLQEAAHTLRLSRSAKTVQYI